MLSSIHPLGERGRSNSYAVTAAAHVVGSIGGGLAVGVAAGTVGAVVAAVAGDGAWRPALVAVVAAVGIAGDLTGRIPTRERQVDESWLTTYRGWVYGFGYGAQLGAGVLTVISSWLIPLTWVVALATAGPLAGAAVGATYGATRGLAILAGRGIGSAADLRRFHAALAERARLAGAASTVGLALAGAVAVTLLLLPPG